MLFWPAPRAAEDLDKPKGVQAMLEKGDGIMSTYVGAVEDFRKSAMTASAELRTVLDAGDENLRVLMTQLEQALNLHMAKPVLDRKKPEPVKVEAGKVNGESTGGVRAFP
jgi:hypothetical protein